MCMLTSSFFYSIILEALTLKLSLSSFIFFASLTPSEETNPRFYSVKEILEEKLCSSKEVSFSFPELFIEFKKAVVATELPESLKFFFFMSVLILYCDF